MMIFLIEIKNTDVLSDQIQNQVGMDKGFYVRPRRTLRA